MVECTLCLFGDTLLPETPPLVSITFTLIGSHVVKVVSCAISTKVYADIDVDFTETCRHGESAEMVHSLFTFVQTMEGEPPPRCGNRRHDGLPLISKAASYSAPYTLYFPFLLQGLRF